MKRLKLRQVGYFAATIALLGCVDPHEEVTDSNGNRAVNKLEVLLALDLTGPEGALEEYADYWIAPEHISDITLAVDGYEWGTFDVPLNVTTVGYDDDGSPVTAADTTHDVEADGWGLIAERRAVWLYPELGEEYGYRDPATVADWIAISERVLLPGRHTLNISNVRVRATRTSRPVDIPADVSISFDLYERETSAFVGDVDIPVSKLGT